MFHSRYTPSESDHQTLEKLFVAREALAQSIMEGIRESATTGNKHQRLLKGPRGIGKTHFVALIYHRVKADRPLAERLCITWLNEDLPILSYADLLFAIVDTISSEYSDAALKERLDKLLDVSSTKQREAALESIILEAVAGRTMLLIAENFNQLMLGLKEEGQQKLRAFIQNHRMITTLATTTGLIDDLTERDKTFFQFFRMTALRPLHVEEVLEIWVRLAQCNNDQTLIDALHSPLGHARIRAVHYLVGGSPRTYVIFFDFIDTASLDELLKPFLMLIDNLTPYYQAHMERLAPLQRRIMDVLKRLRGAANVTEIARQTMTSSQSTSAQLGKLREMGYIVQIETKGRSNFYEFQEPLMRVCLEAKELRGRTTELFVKFLRTWFAATDYNDFHSLSRPDRTIEAYIKALEMNPFESSTWLALFGILFAQGKQHTNLHIAQVLTKFFPDNAFFHSLLGLTRYRLCSWDKTVSAIESSLKLDPMLQQKHPSIQLDMAFAQLALGDQLSFLNKMNDLNSELPLETALGKIYYSVAIHDLSQAGTQLEGLVGAAPSSFWSSVTLAEFLSSPLRFDYGHTKTRLFTQIVFDTFCKYNMLDELARGIVMALLMIQPSKHATADIFHWLSVWNDLARSVEEMTLPLKLLTAGVNYLTSGDKTTLLRLPAEERGLFNPWLYNLVEQPDPHEFDGFLAKIELNAIGVENDKPKV